MNRIEELPSDLPRLFELTISSAAELASARAQVRDWLRPRVPPTVTDEVIIALGEALDNALEHGRSPVTLGLEWSSESMLNASVRDAGAWRASSDVETRGFGIPIMRALMDSLTVHRDGGTVVRLSRRFDP